MVHHDLSIWTLPDRYIEALKHLVPDNSVILPVLLLPRTVAFPSPSWPAFLIVLAALPVVEKALEQLVSPLRAQVAVVFLLDRVFCQILDARDRWEGLQ